MEAFFFSIFVEHAGKLTPVPQLRRLRVGRGWVVAAAALMGLWWPSRAIFDAPLSEKGRD